MTYAQMKRKEELYKEFTFTGMWERSFDRDAVEAMKKRAKQMYKGYKTRVVRGDGGVSIYVEHKYNIDKQKKELGEKIAAYEARRENARLRYEAGLAKLAEEQEEYIKRLSELA